MDSVTTYSEARNEYLKQLSTWIVPYMIQHYRGIWSEAFRVGGQQRVMVVFQDKCAEVPKWNQDIIDSNISKLLDSCRCDYLEELMAAVFIAHTKVLIAIRVSSKHKKLQITLPKLDHFLHRVFSECARSFWKTPYLFLDDAKPIEMQKNLLQAEALCSESIATAVRSMLPIKSILNEYLSDDVMAAEPVIEEGPATLPIDATGPTGAAPVAAPVAEPVAEPVAAPVAEPEAVAEPVATPVGASADDDQQKQEQAQEPVSRPEESNTKTVAITSSEEADSSKAAVPVQSGGELKEEIAIDTERSVHFGDYDNVFPAGEPASFDYNPKNSEEPELRIIEENAEMSLSMDSMVTELEPSGAPVAGAAEETMVLSADEILE